MKDKEKIIKEVEDRVTNELKGKVDSTMFGYIHIFESRKKEILEREYGIKFETLREKDLGCSID